MKNRLSCTCTYIQDIRRFYGYFVMPTEVNLYDPAPLLFRGETYGLNLPIVPVGCLTDDRISIVGDAIPSSRCCYSYVPSSEMTGVNTS